MLAMLTGLVAFSIDGMLPGIPIIANDQTPQIPSKAQEVILFFVPGMGIGTFVVGPISDCIGIRPVIVPGLFIYITMASVAYFTNSMETLLLARFFKGFGTAAPRIVTQAIIRDIYSGLEMA